MPRVTSVAESAGERISRQRDELLAERLASLSTALGRHDVAGLVGLAGATAATQRPIGDLLTSSAPDVNNPFHQPAVACVGSEHRPGVPAKN